MHGRWVLIVVAMALVLPVVSGPYSRSVSEDAPNQATPGCPTSGDPAAPSGPPVSSPASAGRAPLPALPEHTPCEEDPVPLEEVERTADDLLDRGRSVAR